MISKKGRALLVVYLYIAQHSLQKLKTHNILSHSLSGEGSKFKLLSDVERCRPGQERSQRLQVMREIVGGKGKF